MLTPQIDDELFDGDAFAARLAADSDPLKLFREALQRGKQVLQQRFRSGSDATMLVPQQTGLTDALVTRAWQRFFAAADPRVALIAVGGYGRGELHPGSDIDLLILLTTPCHDEFRSAIEQFLTLLWDIGLEVGHSVRTVDECRDEALRDVTIVTNLMESRCIAGPLALYGAMTVATSAPTLWNSREFFAAKWEEQQARHRKFHDTAYNLEPNVKEGPGGLRDIQMIGWVVKRHFNAGTLHDLVDHQFLTAQEYQALIDGQGFLWNVRFALHMLAGRREDRLLFDHQKALAELLGYRDEAGHLAVEKFMQAYYRTITELGRLNEMLLQLFQEAILYADSATECRSINSRFRSCNGFIEVTHNGIFQRYPFALLELFLILAQHPELHGVRATTIRLIRSNTELINDTFRNDLRCRSLFMEILRQPHGITHQLRRMNRYGILAAYLPVFARIVGRMQYDLFHVYTVDDHTLMVIRNLRRFTVREHAHEIPFCSQVIQRIPKLELLYLAALFHDIAKGRGGDHSELGGSDAEEFCLHHGLSEYDTALVRWLVKNHLLMSMTAQRKDISDPEVIAEFATAVRDQGRLDHLYLLTVADIRGTSPELWNTWKDALLIQLYTATKHAFRRGLENLAQKDELVREARRASFELLESRDGINLRHAEALWQRLNDDYFIRHDPNEVAWQTESMLRHGNGPLPMVAFRAEIRRGGTEIFIYSADQDHLFAITTTVLDQMGLNIVDARIYTSRDGYTLNSFIVLDEAGQAIDDQRRLQEISQALHDGISRNDLAAMHVTRRRPHRLKHFSIPTEVHFRAHPRQRYTYMELITADRPGLLAQVGRVMAQHGIRVHSAKIATFGERVEDVFFITDAANRPLDDEQQRSALSVAICDRLDQP